MLYNTTKRMEEIISFKDADNWKSNPVLQWWRGTSTIKLKNLNVNNSHFLGIYQKVYKLLDQFTNNKNEFQWVQSYLIRSYINYLQISSSGLRSITLQLELNDNDGNYFEDANENDKACNIYKSTNISNQPCITSHEELYYGHLCRNSNNSTSVAKLVPDNATAESGKDIREVINIHHYPCGKSSTIREVTTAFPTHEKVTVEKVTMGEDHQKPFHHHHSHHHIPVHLNHYNDHHHHHHSKLIDPDSHDQRMHHLHCHANECGHPNNLFHSKQSHHDCHDQSIHQSLCHRKECGCTGNNSHVGSPVRHRVVDIGTKEDSIISGKSLYPDMATQSKVDLSPRNRVPELISQPYIQSSPFRRGPYANYYDQMASPYVAPDGWPQSTSFDANFFPPKSANILQANYIDESVQYNKSMPSFPHRQLHQQDTPFPGHNLQPGPSYSYSQWHPPESPLRFQVQQPPPRYAAVQPGHRPPQNFRMGQTIPSPTPRFQIRNQPPPPRYPVPQPNQTPLQTYGQQHQASIPRSSVRQIYQNPSPRYAVRQPQQGPRLRDSRRHPMQMQMPPVASYKQTAKTYPVNQSRKNSTTPGHPAQEYLAHGPANSQLPIRQVMKYPNRQLNDHISTTPSIDSSVHDVISSDNSIGIEPIYRVIRYDPIEETMNLRDQHDSTFFTNPNGEKSHVDNLSKKLHSFKREVAENGMIIDELRRALDELEIRSRSPSPNAFSIPRRHHRHSSPRKSKGIHAFGDSQGPMSPERNYVVDPPHIISPNVRRTHHRRHHRKPTKDKRTHMNTNHGSKSDIQYDEYYEQPPVPNDLFQAVYKHGDFYDYGNLYDY